MSNREDLLAGAQRCLYEKGYARTTARDIAAASGVSLAAIGYHFGSTEALLNAALIQAIGAWGEELQATLASVAEREAHADPTERFTAIWTRVIASFESHRSLWVASFEAFAQVERAPEVRQYMAEAFEHGRAGLAALFQPEVSGQSEHTAWMVGAFYQALMTGVMAQWLADPAHAPSGRDLGDALRFITTRDAPQTTSE